MLINTAFGVAAVRREWLNVARTLEVGPLRKAFSVILPAAAPTILTGMRISMGIAWLVIVAAEMLVGGTGIGYFVWNEWNNLSLTNVIFAILMIGVVGMAARPVSSARLPRLVDVSRSDAMSRAHSFPSKTWRKRYPATAASAIAVFENVNFRIDKGEFVCVIGHSGCGKTTILNILAGLDSRHDGDVIMDGRESPAPASTAA